MEACSNFAPLFFFFLIFLHRKHDGGVVNPQVKSRYFGCLAHVSSTPRGEQVVGLLKFAVSVSFEACQMLSIVARDSIYSIFFCSFTMTGRRGNISVLVVFSSVHLIAMTEQNEI